MLKPPTGYPIPQDPPFLGVESTHETDLASPILAHQECVEINLNMNKLKLAIPVYPIRETSYKGSLFEAQPASNFRGKFRGKKKV